MKKRMNNLLRHENGQMAILMVMVLPVIFLILALPLDAGIWFLDHRMAQNQADAAALAAAQYLPAADTTLATAAVNTWLVKNGSGPAELDCLVYSDLYPESLPDGDFDTIEVCVRRESPGVFSGLAGLDFIYVGASATAAIVYDVEGLNIPASIIALNPTACDALLIDASSTFTAEGPIMINSDCASFAADFNCSSICKAQGGIQSVGGVQTDASCNPCVVTNVPPFEDPLKDLLPPCFPSSPTPCQDVGPLTVQNGTPLNPEALTGDLNLQPGIYYGGLEISDGSMAPGLYIMAGGGFKLNSNSAFTAQGVFVYNTNDPDCPACSAGGFKEFIINSNAAANFSGMTTGPYAGLLFFQDRANTEKVVFNPNSTFGEGTVYFPSAFVDMNANDNAALQMIADTIKMNNSGAFTARFDGDAFVKVGGSVTSRPALTE